MSAAGAKIVFAELAEGTDYIVLPKSVPGYEDTVFEVFSYACPFCYKYDKAVLPKLILKLNPSLKFTYWHLQSKGTYGSAANKLFAALITKDEKAGLGSFDSGSSFKKAKDAYYDAYHNKKERWDAGEDSFLQFGLKAAGITEAEFELLLAAPASKERLVLWENALDIAKIQGVPAFVVDGKYLLYTKNIKSLEGMAAAINALAAKK